MRPSGPLRPIVLALACAACSPAVVPGPDEAKIEIPLPSGSVQVDLTNAPGWDQGMNPQTYPIASVHATRAQVEADGTARAYVTLVRHQVELLCSDFGCQSWWLSKDYGICLKVASGAVSVTAVEECGRAAGLPLDTPPADPVSLRPNVSVATGAPLTTIEAAEGVVLADVGGRVEWLGGVRSRFALGDMYGDWLANGTDLTQEWSVRATFQDGVLAGPPVVEPSPGGVPLVKNLTVALGPDGARSVVLRTRESSLIALDTGAGPLTGRQVGEGFHLPASEEWNEANTVGAFLIGDQLVELFLVPSEKILADIAPGATGGNARPFDLHAHLRTKLDGQPGTFHPFTALHARAAPGGGAVVCFDRPIDPTSLGGATASLSGGVAVTSITPSFAPACVDLAFSGADSDTGYTVTISGVKDTAGRVLPVTEVSLLTRDDGLIDLPQVLLQGEVTLGLYPLGNGGVIGWLPDGAAGPIGGPLVEWGPDLFTQRRVDLPAGTRVVAVVPDTARGRLWAVTDTNGSRGILRYDGRTRVHHAPDAFTTYGGFDTATLYGDGSLLVGSTPVARVTDDGIQAATVPQGAGVVLDSTDYVVHEYPKFVRRTLDGTDVASATFGDPWSGARAWAVEDGVTYACMTFGAFRLDASGPVPLVVKGEPATPSPCADLVRDLDGGLGFWCQTGGTAPLAFTLDAGTVHPRIVADPILGASVGRFVFAPSQLGDRVFFWARGDYYNAQNYPVTLRVTSRAGFDRLVGGAP